MLDCEVPELVDVITSRVVIPDDTLIPTRNRAAHPELYSGKRRRSGAAVRSCRAPTAGCTTSVNRSLDPSTT